MKNKKIFIEGLRSFLIIGGFLSPSYNVFAMKRSTKNGSPKMKISPNKKKNMTIQRVQKDKKLTECDSNIDPSKKENNNSKQVCYSKLKEMSDRTFNMYSKLFKDKNFGELGFSKDDIKALGEKFQIMKRIDDFDKGQDVFLKKFMDIDTTVCQEGVFFTVGQEFKLGDKVVQWLMSLIYLRKFF